MVHSSRGYVQVYTPGKRHTYTDEHTLIARKVLGRTLNKGEVVHHINGDKTDNRHENLLICDRSYHNYIHQEMARRYQQEHFPRV